MGGDLSQLRARPTSCCRSPTCCRSASSAAARSTTRAKEGIVHRDIKPANIMVARGTDVKIADFGAADPARRARWCRPRDGLALLHVARADPGRGRSNFHSDMYSLGVVLYELLVGQAALHRREPRGADREDHQVRSAAALRGAQGPAEGRSTRRAARAARRRRRSATPRGREFALELSKAVAQLVLPPGAIPDSEKYVVLKKVPMLSVLSDAELWELAARRKLVAHARRTSAIVSEKDEGHQLLLPRQGRGQGDAPGAPAQHGRREASSSARWPTSRGGESAPRDGRVAHRPAAGRVPARRRSTR